MIRGALLTSAIILAACSSTEPAPPATQLRSVSGRIVSTMSSVSGVGVQISLDGLRSMVTDDSSRYRFDSVANGTHSVAPMRTGVIFEPTSRSIAVADADVTEVNFTMQPVQLPPDSIVFVRIEPGTFNMGCDGGGYLCEASSVPQHKVTLTKAFNIATTECTQALWDKLMSENESEVKGMRYPVSNVKIDSVVVFCNRLSLLHGLTPCYSGTGKNISFNKAANGYRLPSETEWEYACAAGSETAISGIPDPEPGTDLEVYYKEVDKVAWHRGTLQGAPDARRQPVGLLRPNAWGLYDMHGNAAEWVFGGPFYYTADDVVDPEFVPISDGNVVYRGGQNDQNNILFHLDSRWGRISYRYNSRLFYLGFRLARNAD